MSRIEACINALKADGRKALIPYVTAGDPHPDQTVEIMHALVDAGADIIELGVPFSDPMADGPVIQLACERALAHGTSLNQVLAMVKTFRKKDADTPIVLMGYLNPVVVMGYANFVNAAKEAGVDGVLSVDLPPEEAEEFVPLLSAANIDPIFLLAPTTTDERIKHVCEYAGGYVYYVSLKGVTGAGNLDTDDVARQVARIRQFTDVPVGVGFGIRDAESARAVGASADGVVVGSAIIQAMLAAHEAGDSAAAAANTLVSSIRQGLDA